MYSQDQNVKTAYVEWKFVKPVMAQQAEAGVTGFSRNLVGHATTSPDGTYRDLYLYCARHTLGSHVGIYNYEHFGNLYTTGPKDFFTKTH